MQAFPWTSGAGADVIGASNLFSAAGSLRKTFPTFRETQAREPFRLALASAPIPPEALMRCDGFRIRFSIRGMWRKKA